MGSPHAYGGPAGLYFGLLMKKLDPPNPLELVQRPTFAELIREMTNKFDHVTVDTPPMAHGADSRALASICGAALIVGRRSRTRMKVLDALVSSLTRSRTAVAGVVLNRY
jgi:Mrp family chromosome partitioning ATPase